MLIYEIFNFCGDLFFLPHKFSFDFQFKSIFLDKDLPFGRQVKKFIVLIINITLFLFYHIDL